VNWAQQNQQVAAAPKEETPNQHQIFVGDIAPEVTDEILAEAFSPFGTIV
jgi:nucleolysin TIA-1/TIAR